jgi:hypothetical protein
VTVDDENSLKRDISFKHGNELCFSPKHNTPTTCEKPTRSIQLQLTSPKSDVVSMGSASMVLRPSAAVAPGERQRFQTSPGLWFPRPTSFNSPCSLQNDKTTLRSAILKNLIPWQFQQ